jgi:hypothetical protein
VGKAKEATTLLQTIWDEMNARQQTYLRVIYDLDQQAEAMEHSRWSRGGRSRPADTWRWILYGILPELGHDSPLRAQLRAAKLVDPGTGATFQALESRGLIWCRCAGDEQVRVRITPKGRQVVRVATGETSAVLHPGTLREWHWAALAKAYAAGGVGIPSDGAGRYGGIGWNTWLRLRDYAEAALIKEGEPTFTASGVRIYLFAITPFGKWFYAEHFDKYQAMYPNVAARKPWTKHPKPVEVAPLHPKRLHVRAIND